MTSNSLLPGGILSPPEAFLSFPETLIYFSDSFLVLFRCELCLPVESDMVSALPVG